MQLFENSRDKGVYGSLTRKKGKLGRKRYGIWRFLTPREKPHKFVKKRQKMSKNDKKAEKSVPREKKNLTRKNKAKKVDKKVQK